MKSKPGRVTSAGAGLRDTRLRGPGGKTGGCTRAPKAKRRPVCESGKYDRAAQREFDLYCGQALSREDLEIGPLKWWPQKSHLHPLLSVVAKAVFTMPASQSDVERIFSVAGYTSANRRNRMSIEVLEELVYINKNYPDELGFSLPDRQQASDKKSLRMLKEVAKQ